MRRNFNSIEKFVLAEKSEWKCSICGCELPDDWHADHIKPVSKGGRTWLPNGQATCPSCNLKKGNSMEINWDEIKKLRKWQEKALAKHQELRSGSPNKTDYLYQATPGAGKTRLTIEILLYEKQRGAKPFIVIVSPSKALTIQWAEDMSRYGFNITEDYTSKREDTDGWSITYQAVLSQATTLHSLVNSRHVIIVFDEIHHLSDKNIWGAHNTFAFKGAALRIGLTGTPFRSDNRQIAFVTYKDGVCAPDFKLTYAEALSYKDDEKMVRSISFPYFEGHMSWVSENGVIDADFETDLDDDKEEANRLRTALNPNKGYFQEMCRHADDKLNEIRANGFKRAAGIIFCLDQSHARTVAAYIERLTGETACLVISSEEDSIQRLEAFKTSTGKWLVCVGMVAEGVDIPRAIVGVYATNITTLSHFWQVVFRIGRYINDGITENSVAYMYLPKHKVFIDYAENILKEIEDYIDSIETADIPEPGGLLDDTKIRLRDSVYMALFSTGAFEGQIFDGDHYPVEFLATVAEVKDEDPALALVDLALLAKAISRYTEKKQTKQQPAKPQKSYDKRIKDLRDEITPIVESLAGRFSRQYRKNMDDCIVGINAFLKNRFGARNDLSESLLTEQKNLLVEKIHDLSWWKRNIYVQ